MKRVFLTVPPTGLWLREDRCQAPIAASVFAVIRPPMRLAFAAAVLESAGYECIIHDYPAEGRGWESFEADLRLFMPDVLFISTVRALRLADGRACTVARRISPGCLSIMKGAPVGEEIGVFEECPDLDLFMTREIDERLIDIIERQNWHDIPGIAWSQDGQIVSTIPAPFVEDLDSQPFPARHLLNNELYRRPDTGEKLTVIEASRGCPFRCTFCASRLGTGPKLRKRSPASIVTELEQCVHRFGITNFLLGAETFTADKRWVLELCGLIREKQLRITWSCNSRADTIDEELAVSMKSAGCMAMSLGIESGSQETLDRLRKGITLSQCEAAVSVLRKAGIQSLLYFIIGFPWETREMIEQTISFAIHLDGDVTDVYPAIPLDGTEIRQEAEAMGILYEDPSSNAGYAMASTLVPPAELKRLQRKAFFRIYRRPQYILRTLRMLHSGPGLFRVGSMAIRHLLRKYKKTTL